MRLVGRQPVAVHSGWFWVGRGGGDPPQALCARYGRRLRVGEQATHTGIALNLWYVRRCGPLAPG